MCSKITGPNSCCIYLFEPFSCFVMYIYYIHILYEMMLLLLELKINNTYCRMSCQSWAE